MQKKEEPSGTGDPLGPDCCGFDDEPELPQPTNVPEPHLLALRDSADHPLPFHGTYWVSYPMLLAGPYPGDHEADPGHH